MTVYRGLLLFFVLEYVRPTAYIPGLDLLHLNAIVPLAVVGLSVLGARKVNNVAVFSELNIRIVLALFGLIVLSVLTADVTLYAFTVMNNVLGYLLIGWVLAKEVTSLDQLKGVFRTLTLVHIAVAALTPQMFLNPDVRHYVASGSFLGDGNDFALSVNLTIPFCLFLLTESKKTLSKVFWAGSLLLLVLSVVATQSRGGTLALGCVAVYYWLKSDRKVVTATVAAAALVLVLVSAPPEYFNRMNTIASHQDGSAQGRLLAWAAGTQMALDHPLLGVGAGHFPTAYGSQYRSSLDIPWQTAHSIYFLILGELGFPGLAVLLLFIVSNLIANRRLLVEIRDLETPDRFAPELRLLASLSAAVIAYATGGAFLSAVYYPHLFVLAGLLAAARRVIRERLQEQDSTTTVASAPAGIWIHPALRRPVGALPATSRRGPTLR